MLNYDIIPCMNTKKILTFVIVTLLMLNMNFTADGFSVKLRGKLALAGILSGAAILTISLVEHDRNVSENLLSELGRAEAIWKIDRGFDAWYVHQFKEHSYYFLNNRYIQDIQERPPNIFLGSFIGSSPIGSIDKKLKRENMTKNRDYITPFLIDTSFLANPTWLSFSLSHQQRVPLSVFLYLHQSADGRLLHPAQWHYYLK